MLCFNVVLNVVDSVANLVVRRRAAAHAPCPVDVDVAQPLVAARLKPKDSKKLCISYADIAKEVFKVGEGLFAAIDLPKATTVCLYSGLTMTKVGEQSMSRYS